MKTKVIIVIVAMSSIVLMAWLPKSNFLKTSNKTVESKNNTMESQEIVNVALFYLNDGKEHLFEQYKREGGKLLEKYGAKIERVIKPKMMANGDIELPDEIHFASYPNIEAFHAFNEDPKSIKLRDELAIPAIASMSVFPSKNTDFEYEQEHGDLTKTFGVALVYFKEGDKYPIQFAEYHDEVCGIIPEFGAHFERFVAPFDAKGELSQPNEIHRFYFDTPEGMQQMAEDQRMQSLFPKRDASLSNLIFVIGEATL